MSLQNIGFSRFLLRTYSIPLALASCYCAELFRPLDSCVENAEHLVCTEELQAFDTLRNGRGGTCLVMTWRVTSFPFQWLLQLKSIHIFVFRLTHVQSIMVLSRY